jgi:hypothetical protein
MDVDRFDKFTRALTEERSRRGVARLLGGLAVGGSLGWLGFAEAMAKKKKKKKKRKSPAPPPPPPPPFCTGQNRCVDEITLAPCHVSGSTTECFCWVAVGTGVPFCGQLAAASPVGSPCSAQTGCGAGETCVDLSECGPQTGCSKSCPYPR